MRWRPIVEEYNPELIYIQGPNNIAADELSRSDIVDTNNPIKPNISSLAEHFSYIQFIKNYYAISIKR